MMNELKREEYPGLANFERIGFRETIEDSGKILVYEK